jgi:hypothetical protein
MPLTFVLSEYPGYKVSKQLMPMKLNLETILKAQVFFLGWI